MKLSIIIPFFNSEDNILNCLYSIENQGFDIDDYEVVLINDGSTDNGKEKVESYIKKKKNYTIINQKNRGPEASRNVGLKIAKGKYVYFIDADDYLAYNTFGYIISIALENDLDIIGFKTQVTERKNLFSSKSNFNNINYDVLSGCDFLAFHSNHRFEIWWYLIKRDFLLNTDITFVEDNYLDDANFTFRLFIVAKRFSFLQLDVHRYVKTPNSVMNNENNEHLKKIIENYVSLTHNFNQIMHEISLKKVNNFNQIVKTISYKRSVSIYFMFYKLIKSSLTIKEINLVLSKLQALDAYPFYNFIGKDYHTLKFKLTSFVFNNKYVFSMLLYPIRILHKLKIIKLY